MDHVDRASPLLDASTEGSLARGAPVGAADSTPRRTHPTRQHGIVLVGCLAAAVGGALADAAPTGNRVADRLLAVGFVGLLAAAGSTAERWTWFVAAGAAPAMAGGPVAVGAGGTALILALAATRPVRPAPAVGVAVGGLSALALLRTDDLWFHGASALLGALVTTPMLLSGYRHAGRRARRDVRCAVGVAVVALVVVAGSYGALLARSRGEVERGIELLEQGMAAARDGDDRRAEQRFGHAADAFGAVEAMLAGWWAEPAEMVPVLGHNARAIQAMSTTAADLSRRGREAAADADVDEVTIEGGRLDLDRVRALEQPLVDVSASLDAAAARLDAVDTPWLVAPVADRITGIREEVADARPDARLAADAVRVVPAIFGGVDESRWLVAFVTPVEARGRVGFMGNFAELTAVDGDVEMARFGRTSELQSGGTPAERRLTGPADYLARWGRYSPATTWQNVTMSPDFPSVGRVMAELYPQSGGRPVEGVIAVDPTGLAALLEFTGPVAVRGIPEPLTADNAARFMLVDQYVALPDPSERVDALEALAEITFERLTSGDLPGPREVADTLRPAVRGGHIQLYSGDPAQQDLFTEIGADGALPPVDGDFLAVVTSNATGNKIDVFLSRHIDYHATWDPTSGEVAADLQVSLVNDAPRSGLPDSVIGNALDDEEGSALVTGTNRTHVSVYSPLVLEAAALDGEGVEIAPEVERDRYAYSIFLDVPPEGGTRTLRLTLRGRIALDGRAYRLEVANQPLVNPDRLAVVVESTTGGPLRASAPMDVDGATASAAVRATEHEIAFRVAPDG